MANNSIGPSAVIVQTTGRHSTVLCSVLSSSTPSVSAANLPTAAACSAVTTTQSQSSTSTWTKSQLADRLKRLLA